MPEAQRQHRRRPQLSCELCKRRKVKCNRELPCDQCYKLSKGRSCVYKDTLLPASSDRASDTVSPDPPVVSHRDPTLSHVGLEAHTNLQQTRYMGNPAHLRDQHQHDIDLVTTTFIEDAGTTSVLARADDTSNGSLDFLGDEWATSFHGNSHWSSVFSQVRCAPIPSSQLHK